MKLFRSLTPAIVGLLAAFGAHAQTHDQISSQINTQIVPNTRGQITASAINGILNALNDNKAPIQSPTFSGIASMPAINLTTSGSTGPIDGMSVTPPSRGVSSTLNKLLDGTMTLASFGAKDDNSTDNTATVQAAVTAAAASGRTLRVTASTGGTGVYRVGPSINWQNVNLDFDEKAGFANLDGTAYSGTFYSGFAGLPAVFNPQIAATGRRAVSPGRRAAFLSTPGDTHETFTVYNGTAAIPYDVTSGERSYTLLGQSTASSGSWAGLGIFANVYNHSNGPGFNITCTGTNGSNVLTNCLPAPNGTHTVTLADGTTKTVGNVFNPARVTGTGLPTGTYAAAWDASTITLAAANTFYSPQNFTGTTGSVTVNVQSGRSEFNTNSFQINPIGTTSAGGPAGGMNWYPNDNIVGTNISTNPADQEGFLAGLQVGARKQVPGNAKDVLHNGSYILPVYSIPNTGTTTYTMDAGIAVTGWSGPASTTSGNATGATPFAKVGVDVGNGCSSIYCYFSSPSYVGTAFQAQGYDTGMIFANPHPGTFSGTAIYLAPGAGNIDLRDNLYVGKSIFEPNPGTPASSTAPCSIGQHAWDTNYEYRCVATNHWRRIAFTSDWP